MPIISEKDLILPSLYLLSQETNKKLSTTDLRTKLRELLSPGGEDLQQLAGRNDDKFSQKVRNLRTHRTLENNNMTTYSTGEFTLTNDGETHISDNLDKLALIIEEEKFLNVYSSQISNYYMEFITSTTSIEELCNSVIVEDGSKRIKFYNMLYSSIITSLETYLGDAIKYNINQKKMFLRNFVENFDDYKKTGCKINNIITLYETLEDRVDETLIGLMYHNLSRIGVIYKITFNIDFPPIDELSASVNIRHDLVHRNGKMKDGTVRNISKKDILELKQKTYEFIKYIDDQFTRVLEEMSEDN